MGGIERRKGDRSLPVGVPAPENVEDAAVQSALRALQANLFDHEARLAALERRGTGVVEEARPEPVVPRLPELGTVAPGHRVHVVERYSGLEALRNVREGDQGYVRESKQWFGWRGPSLSLNTKTWRALHPWIAATEAWLMVLGASYGVKEGDIGFASMEGTVWYWNDAQWRAFEDEILHIAEDFAALDAIDAPDGHFGYVEDEEDEHKHYGRQDGAWEPLGGGTSIIIADTYDDLKELTPDDGAVGYILDHDRHYLRQNGAWRAAQPFIVADSTAMNALTAANAGVADGDLAYATTADVHYMRQNGAWVAIPGLSSSAPQSVGTANSAGTANTASRSDHVHSSNFRVNDGKGQWRSGSTWFELTHFE